MKPNKIKRVKYLQKKINYHLLVKITKKKHLLHNIELLSQCKSYKLKIKLKIDHLNRKKYLKTLLIKIYLDKVLLKRA